MLREKLEGKLPQHLIQKVLERKFSVQTLIDKDEMPESIYAI